MKWISVKDRLPEKKEDNFSEMVLLSIVGGTMFVGWFDYELNEWQSDNGLPELPIYWRPLPEPPNEDNTDTD